LKSRPIDMGGVKRNDSVLATRGLKAFWLSLHKAYKFVALRLGFVSLGCIDIHLICPIHPNWIGPTVGTDDRTQRKSGREIYYALPEVEF